MPILQEVGATIGYYTGSINNEGQLVKHGDGWLIALFLFFKDKGMGQIFYNLTMEELCDLMCGTPEDYKPRRRKKKDDGQTKDRVPKRKQTKAVQD
jgi:hypothetical protein